MKSACTKSDPSTEILRSLSLKWEDFRNERPLWYSSMG